LPAENDPMNPLRRSQIPFNELTIEKEIGEGSYGRVCLGKWNTAIVALKFCRKREDIDDFLREAKIMMYVHQNLCLSTL
jgi:serine/threonine protein kinase